MTAGGAALPPCSALLIRCGRQASLRRLATALLLLSLLPLLLLLQATDVRHPPGSLSADCTRLFRLSTCRHRWEKTLTLPAATCSDRHITGDQVRRCVRPPPGAQTSVPPRVVFIGDSRIAYIYRRFLHRMGVSYINRTEPIPLGNHPHFVSLNMTVAPPECQEIYPRTVRGPGEEVAKKRYFCSTAGGDRSLRLEHHWRPFLSRSYVATVSDLVEQCERQLPSCPRLVVLDSGLWYGLRFSVTEGASAANWAARYRQDLAVLLPLLRRLTTHTHVIWKLDEPQFQEEIQGAKPGIVMSVLPVLQSAVYSLTADIPSLTVWSAMLPDTISHHRNVCWLGRIRTGSRTAFHIEQCTDIHHVGVDLQDRYVSQLLNWLCRGSELLQAGDCCGSVT